MCSSLKFARELAVLYEVFDWKWNDDYEPPTAERIQEQIEKFIREVESGCKQIEGGGIRVTETDYGMEIEWSLTKSMYIDEQD